MPVGRSFENSPLARWQAAQRAEREDREAWQRQLAAAAQPSPADAFLAAADADRQRRRARAALIRFHEAKRRAAKLQRTPAWADHAAIAAIYAEAAQLTRETGVQHHVDHRIPLQGRRVSGLHVHTNLQILTGAENSRKGNRFQPSDDD